MLQPYLNHRPKVSTTARVHDLAVLIGDVTLGDQSSVWPGAVLRADMDAIRIGKRTSIQDGCVIHTDHGRPALVGDDCVVGHQACIHACTVGNRVLVGIHATLLTGSEVGDECVIGAGALVGEGKRIPPRSLVLGVPGSVVRSLTDEDVHKILGGVSEYLTLMKQLPENPTP